MPRFTNVKGYRKKDGTYVQSHTRVTDTREVKSRDVYNEPYKPQTRLRHANSEIADLIRNRYFKHVPMTEIQDILEKNGFRLPEEGFILTGHKGKAQWKLYDNMRQKETNDTLHVSWYRMPSGRFEIVSYVSTWR